MKKIMARTLLNYSTTQLHDMLHGEFILKFDDGSEAQVHYRNVLYSSYFWDFFRAFPHTPFLPKHCVDSVLKGGQLTSKTHIEFLGVIFWDVVEAYKLVTAAQRNPLVEMIYQITNVLYNDLSQRAEEYVVSIDILDFVAMVSHPEIEPVLEAVDGSRESLDLAYSELLRVLNHSPDVAGNALARAVRAKMVNANQVLQCLGPRGFVTEVDGHILPTPVTRSFTSGMRTVYNAVAESRPAAKSLFYAEAPLQDAEYFARRLQLLCMTIETLHYEDCGTTNYLQWRVKGPTNVNGKQIYPGDLKFLLGKRYLDETDNTLKTISAKCTHLYGTTIKMRSVLGCKHHDKHGVCSVCFGELGDNISPHANLGHICAATMTQQTGQNILGAKHLEASCSVETIALDAYASKFLAPSPEGSAYLFNKNLQGTGAKCIVAREEAFGLTDINLVNDVSDINPTRVSEVFSIAIAMHSDGMVNKHPIVIERNGQAALMTHEFLSYLKTHGWELDELGNFMFDLSNWDFTKPVFKLPEVEYNFSQHSKEIATIIESRMKDITERAKPESPVSTLIELFDLVNAKLNVNIALLEVIIYASVVRNIEEGDMGLGRGLPTATLGISESIIKGRSLSNALAYEDQAKLITDPRSFFKFNRPDSVFDAFITPHEAVMDYRSKLGL